MNNNELRVNRVLLIKLISFMMIVCSVVSGIVFTSTKADTQGNALSIVKTLSANSSKVLRASSGVIRKTQVKSTVNENVITESNEQGQDANIAKILAENDNVSVLFDKNGDFIKAVIYNEFGKDTKFVRIENGEAVYYKNIPYRIFSLRKSGVSQVLGDAENNTEAIDYTRTVSHVSDWNALDEIIKNGGNVQITADLTSGIQNGTEETDSTKRIIIENDVVIDGAGHNVTRGNNAGLFEINAKNVTFCNFSFKGEGIKSAYVAFKMNSGSLEINNCEFDNFSNTGIETSGGVICACGYGSLSISGCTFRNMISTTDGGAVYTQNGVSLTVDNSNFENVAVFSRYYGGSIYAAGDLTVENTVFNGNTDIDSNEKQNVNAYYGGAIYSVGQLTVASGCRFENNTAVVGGAVCGSNVSIVNSKSSDKIIFENNTAELSGGAVNANSVKFSYNENRSASPLEVCFNNNRSLNETTNKSAKGGGAICAGSISVEEFNIGNNESISVKFNGNSAYLSGGAVYTDSMNSIEKMSFEGNKTGLKGGAVFIAKSVETDVKNASFYNNEAQSGGAIYAGGAVNVLENSVFDGNTAVQNGGAICMSGTKPLNCEESGIRFTANKAGRFGGAIFGSEIRVNEKEGSLTDFSNNEAGIDGGAVYSLAKDVNVNNAHFYKNRANGNGGDIYSNKGKLTVKNSRFFGNDANNKIESTDEIINAKNGGSIYVGNANEINVSNSTFNSYITSGDGGAIYIKATAANTGTAPKAKFYVDNNAANNKELAKLHLRKASKQLIFNGNKASGDGGAICAIDIAVEILGGEFTGNVSSKGNGGALYADSELKIGGNSKFDENCAKNGGAVYATVKNNSDGVVIRDTNLTNNSATNNGGAICADAQLSLMQSYVDYNRAKNGGAIYTKAQLTLSQSYIICNKAVNGGGIYSTGECLTITDEEESDGKAKTAIAGNEATKNGGGVFYIYSGEKALESHLSLYSGFISANTAENGGGIYTNDFNIKCNDSCFVIGAKESDYTSLQTKNYYIFDDDGLKESFAKITNDSSYVTNIVKFDGSSMSFDGYVDMLLSIGNRAQNGGGIYFKIADGYCEAPDNSNAQNSETCFIVNNFAECGGGLYIDSSVAFSMRWRNNLNISENIAIKGGGIATKYNGNNDLILSGFITTENMAIEGNSVYIINSDEANNQTNDDDGFDGVRIVNSEFKNGFNPDGGAVYSEARLEVVNTIFENNEAAKNGGAVYCEEDADFDGCTFINNRASVNGGAVYCEKNVSFKNCTFTENTATQNGGAIYANGKITVDGGVFNGNAASGFGGAVYSENDITSNGASFEKNGVSSDGKTALTQNGGAIYANGKITVDGGVFNGNAASNLGGAVYSENDITSNGVSFEKNGVSADGKTTLTQNGGAIYAKGDISVDNGTISANKAMGSGGALYAESGIYTGNCTADDNYSGEDGGAIYAKGEVISLNDKFSRNTAQFSGGAIYAYGFVTADSSYFYSNTAKNKDGGAIYTSGRIYIDNNCQFKNNEAKISGGAVTVVNQSDVDDRIENSKFENNKIITGKGNSIKSRKTQGFGGAVYLNSVNFFYLTDCSFNSNSANYGGGVYIERANNIEIDGTNKTCDFNANSSYYGGGALYINSVNDNHTVDSSEITIGKDVLFNANVSNSENGAAVYINGRYSNKAVIKATFTNNKATEGCGGAVFARGIAYSETKSPFTVSLEGAVFNKNSAKNGAGVCIDSNARLETSNDVIFSECDAFNFGGGIYFGNGVSANLSSAEIANNKAKKGAGIYIGNNANIELTDLTVRNNTSDLGAGIYIGENSNAKLNSSNIYNQNAKKGAGIYTSDSSTLEVNGTVINGNTASEDGAGIYISANGGSSNNSSCIKFAGDDTAVSNNEAANCGGGIFTESYLYLDAPLRITGNKAKYGGGIYANGENRTVTLNGAVVGSENTNTDIGAINDGTVESVLAAGGNKAEYGGGIFLKAALLRLEGSSANAVTGESKICGNIATIAGGGIFSINNTSNVSSSIELSGVKQHSIRVSKNISVLGGAVYTDTGKITVSNYSFVTDNVSIDDGGAFYIGRNDLEDYPEYPDIDMDNNERCITLTVKTGATIQNNKSLNGNGGAVYFKHGTFNINGGDIIGNRAVKGFGGGLYIDGGWAKLNYGNIGAENSPNRAKRGGGIYINAGEQCLLGKNTKGLNVSYNVGGFGGGIYSKDGKDTILHSGLNVSNNTATDSSISEGCGGGMMIENSPTFDGAKISANTASYGGGLFFGYENNTCTIINDKVEILNASITDNNALTSGGGIYIRYGRYEFGNSVVISGNQAQSTGMGICLNHWKNKNSNNEIYYDDIELTLNGSKIINNRISPNSRIDNTMGGGIYVNIGGKLVINKDTEIYGNNLIKERFQSYGGGIYADMNSTVSFNGGTVGGTDIEHANCAVSGGGIYINRNANVLINKTSESVAGISGNYASKEGGGICIYNGNLQVNNANESLPDDNTVPAVRINNNQVDGTGAAVYVVGDSICNIYDADISHNIAVSQGNDSNGGALYVADGNVKLVGCSITDNTANKKTDSGMISGCGGMMYFYGGNITVSNSIVTGNNAQKNGGAIYGDLQGSGKAATLTINASEFTDNECAGNGGAIAIKGNLKLVIEDTKFLRNKANGDINSMWLSGVQAPTINRCIFDDGISYEQQIVELKGIQDDDIPVRSATVSGDDAENNLGDLSSEPDDGVSSEQTESEISSNFDEQSEVPDDSSHTDSSDDSQNSIAEEASAV